MNKVHMVATGVTIEKDVATGVTTEKDVDTPPFFKKLKIRAYHHLLRTPGFGIKACKCSTK
jgi:hypothetical protein